MRKAPFLWDRLALFALAHEHEISRRCQKKMDFTCLKSKLFMICLRKLMEMYN